MKNIVTRIVVGTLAMLVLVSWSSFGGTTSEAGKRQIMALDGQGQIAESKSPAEIPADFTHTVPVPGSLNRADNNRRASGFPVARFFCRIVV